MPKDTRPRIALRYGLDADCRVLDSAEETATDANYLSRVRRYLATDTLRYESVCNGPCAKHWPPLMASGSAMASGNWTVVTRDDGGKQWAYEGKPLYLWIKDHKPGDKTGDGFNKVWHVALP